MTFSKEDIEELKKISPHVSLAEEGGAPFFLIPELELPPGCVPNKVDVLLCPVLRDGYNSRLYFAEKIQTAKSLNWNSNNVRILERNWYAFSWQINPSYSLVKQI